MEVTTVVAGEKLSLACVAPPYLTMAEVMTARNYDFLLGAQA